MFITLFIIFLLRDECNSMEIASNSSEFANKTLILRLANDELKDDLSDVKKYEDILSHVALPTTEPLDFMDNYRFTGLSWTTPKRSKFSSPMADWYITKRTTKKDLYTNHFVTFAKVSEQTEREHGTSPPMPVSLNSEEFWKKVYSTGFWNHLDNQLNRSYVTDPKRTSTYATKLTTGRGITPKTTTEWVYNLPKLPLITDGKWVSETDEFFQRRHGETVLQGTQPVSFSTVDTTT